MSKAAAILKNVCRQYGVTPNELRGQARNKNLLSARVEFSRLGRMQGWSLPLIGRLLNRDHTTVLYYLKKTGKQA